jgi:hypothetical protein
MNMDIRASAAVVLFAAGLLFLWALVLGVWKWRAMVTSPDGLAHPYVDTAHRAALLYAFATGLIAAFVQLSGWPPAVNLAAAGAMVLLFTGMIANYVRLGRQRKTDNQMRGAPREMNWVLAALIAGEIGGLCVLLAGFAEAQF